MHFKFATISARVKSAFSLSTRRSSPESTTTAPITVPTVSILTSASTSVPEGDITPSRPLISTTPALKRACTRFSVRSPEDAVVNAPELPASSASATTRMRTTPAAASNAISDATRTTEATRTPVNKKTKAQCSRAPPSSFNFNSHRFSISSLVRSSSSSSTSNTRVGDTDPASRTFLAFSSPSKYVFAGRCSIRTNGPRTTFTPAEIRRGHRINLEFAPAGERRDEMGREKWSESEAEKRSRERRRASHRPVSAFSGRTIVPALPVYCF